MTDTELQILRHLYKNPLESNFTISVLENALNIERNSLEKHLHVLVTNNYVENRSTENQTKMGDPAYRITGYGAKKIHENSFLTFLNRYGKFFTVLFGLIGIVGTAFQIHSSFREEFWHNKQYQLHERQHKIDSLNKSTQPQNPIKDTVQPQKNEIDKAI